ncbi:hypothetical protein HPB51_014034 [Rhipicephalus microplus]|uniref:Uncharacterized protein n=1 Tax=Rhipicephalus microplus TaxID=6941 RepID=A0A9J6DA95_RHIMP|nr:hypothetical protein HPB51_014034 [Rhipicephalus microplus]
MGFETGRLQLNKDAVPSLFHPSIQLFQERQAQLFKDLPEDSVEIADGRCDSPGYSAKDCTYTVLATEVGKILHYEQIRVGEVSK